jgi:hypothetical protein
MILISIPVHSNPETVFDQLLNIKKYAPQSGVVIHIAKQLVDALPELPSKLRSLERVWVNDDPLYTGRGMVLKCHVSNFLYAKKTGLSFSHISLHASNDLLIVSGVEQYIKESNFGFFRFNIDAEEFGFSLWREDFLTDNTYTRMMSDVTSNISRYVSQVEGTFYPQSAFDKFAESYYRHAWREIPWPLGYVHGTNKKMVDLFQRLQRNRKRRKYIGRYFYPREEFYPPNYFSTMCQYPHAPYCYMDWKNSLKVTASNILAIRNGEETLGGYSKLFSVKRIPLDINDPLRILIRNLPV